jgi:uncharacterized membrane protein
MMDFLSPFHPRLVHFPIALSLAGAFFILAGWFLAARPRGGPARAERWQGYGRLSLVLGWLGVLAAGVTGLIDQSRAPDTLEVRELINQHIGAGLALLVVLGLAIYWPIKNKALMSSPSRRWLYFALLVLAAALVLVESWLGGQVGLHLRRRGALGWRVHGDQLVHRHRG